MRNKAKIKNIILTNHIYDQFNEILDNYSKVVEKLNNLKSKVLITIDKNEA